MRKIPEHGTPQRYKWELRNDGFACQECTSAWTAFHRYYRKNMRVSKLRSRAYEASMSEAGYKITREPVKENKEAVSVEETA